MIPVQKRIKLACIMSSFSFLLIFITPVYAGNGGDLEKTEDNKSHPPVQLGESGYVSIYDTNARKIMSMEAVDRSHTKLGMIQDLLIRDGGKIAYAVVTLGGIFEVEDSQFENKLVAIPVKKMIIDVDKMEAVLNISKKELEQSPEFQYVDSSFEYDMSIANLLDLKVVSEDGHKLGMIEDLILTVNDTVNYAVISVGGVLGLEDKLVTAPFNSLQINMTAKKAILSVTEKQLKNAPTFQYREP